MKIIRITGDRGMGKTTYLRVLQRSPDMEFIDLSNRSAHAVQAALPQLRERARIDKRLTVLVDDCRPEVEAILRGADCDNAVALIVGLSAEGAAPDDQRAASRDAKDESAGLPFGIIDPDYARIFTKARILAWQYGFACVMHGSFTRDLDLLLVPWEDRAGSAVVKPIITMLAESCGLTIRADDPTDKPHGRKCWSLHLPGFGEPRWVDISVMPAIAVARASA